MSQRKITELLLRDESALVRTSAAVTLGALGVSDAGTGKALLGALADPEDEVRLQAIIALGRIRFEGALPALLEKFPLGGAEGEESANSIAKLGARGVKALVEQLPKVSPGLRRYIGAALARAGNASSDQAAIDLLSDTDPGMVESTATVLASTLASRTSAQTRAIGKRVGELAQQRGISRATDQAVTRLLSAMDDPSGTKSLWDRISANHSPEVRSAALGSLGKGEISNTLENVRRLVQCAGEGDFRIVAPSLILLQKLKVEAAAIGEWLPLFQAKDPAARQLAVEKLGFNPNSQVAQLLAQQARHPDRRLREAACEQAARSKSGQKALVDSLLAESNYDYAWNLARLMAPCISPFGKGWLTAAMKRIYELVEAQDRNADPLLFLAREADAEGLQNKLLERAQELRKKKKYHEAASFLKILTRDAGCPLETRFELASCLLKISSKELGADSRQGDPALQLFLPLAHREDFALFDSLKKQGWIDLDCYFYLGFHLSEQDARARKVALLLLEHVVKKAGRNKLGQAAKQKIKTNRLGE